MQYLGIGFTFFCTLFLLATAATDKWMFKDSDAAKKKLVIWVAMASSLCAAFCFTLLFDYFR